LRWRRPRRRHPCHEAFQPLVATDDASQGLSRIEANSAGVEAELHDQGLTRTIKDVGVLCQVAGLLGAEDAGARERRLAEVRRELANAEVRIRLDEELH